MPIGSIVEIRKKVILDDVSSPFSQHPKLMIELLMRKIKPKV
jgi:hypothetical protein